MKITFITTVGHNVGDDFVRDGIGHLLRATVGGFEARLVHKHFPASARAGLARWHLSRVGRTLLRLPGLRRPGRLSRMMDLWPLDRTTDAVLSCDVLVQCGAPVYWLNAHDASERNEWYRPLIRRRWRRRSPRPPLLNIGAGACQAFGSDGSEFAAAAATLRFVREFFDECVLTTVRDELSERILALAGVGAPRLPCPSVFARRWHHIEPVPGEYVAVNFMDRAGHYDLDGRIDPAGWRRTLGDVLSALCRTERCVLVCHDRGEEALARRWFPDVERFFATEAADYLRCYARARSGIANRVHGAFALAGFGRPAVIVGADSRARMGAEIGLPVFSAAEASAPAVLEAHAKLRADADGFAVRTLRRIDAAEHEYLRLLRDALGCFRS